MPAPKLRKASTVQWLIADRKLRKLVLRLIDEHCHVRFRYSERERGYFKRGEAPTRYSLLGAMMKHFDITLPTGPFNGMSIDHIPAFAIALSSKTQITLEVLRTIQRVEDHFTTRADRQKALRMLIEGVLPEPALVKVMRGISHKVAVLNPLTELV